MSKKSEHAAIKAALKKYFPKANKSEQGFILFNHTCWPFGLAKDVVPQIKQHARALELKRPQCELCGKMTPSKILKANHGACNTCKRALSGPDPVVKVKA